jgi:hypothetical protein
VQHLEEAFHGWRKNAAGFVDDAERAEVRLAFEFDGGQGAVADFLFDGGTGNDGDAGIDFNGAFDGLDVVKFHDGAEFVAGFTKNFVDGFAGGDIRFKADKFGVRNVFDINFRFFGEGVCRVADDDEAIFAEGFDFNEFFGDGKGDKSEITGAFDNFIIDLIGATIFHGDIDAGELFHELFQVGGEFMQADAVNGGDADGAGDDVAHFGELMLEHLVLVDDLFAGFVEGFAFSGEAEAFIAAFDEGNAVAFLQGTDLLTDGGLRYKVKCGSLAEAFGVDEVTKNFEGFNLHDTIISQTNQFSNAN